MNSSKVTWIWMLSVVVILGLVGCNNQNRPMTNQEFEAAMAEAQTKQAALSTRKFSYADGIDICFKQVRQKIGDAAMVNSIESIFEETDGNGTKNSNPALVVCSVKYQDPNNPKQLLSQAMNPNTGEFKAPRPLELRILNNAEDFKLESILVPIQTVNPLAAAEQMNRYKPQLDAKLTDYTVHYLELTDGGPLGTEHQLSLNIVGKFKSNDTKASIMMEFSPDGKTLLRNGLDKQ
jgi:hypothetical protein